jgi:hypothetical protein
LNFTDVTVTKPVPVMTTLVPTGPLVGVNDVMLVAPAGVKLVVLATVPAPVVTWIGPVEAPAGTVAVIWLFEFTVNVAAVRLNATAVAPQKPLPTMTTDVPVPPVGGENDVIVGATAGVTTWKLDALVPLPSASTTTSCAVPVEPTGTVVVICVSLAGTTA